MLILLLVWLFQRLLLDVAAVGTAVAQTLGDNLQITPQPIAPLRLLKCLFMLHDYVGDGLAVLVDVPVSRTVYPLFAFQIVLRSLHVARLRVFSQPVTLLRCLSMY